MWQEETYEALVDVMQAAIISCNIEKVGPEVTACSQASPFLSSAITNDVVLRTSNNVSVMMDNSFSPAHTLVQIVCQDHKGLVYDIMRNSEGLQHSGKILSLCKTKTQVSLS